MTRSERVRGGVLGLLVGDALGVPYEFHPAEDIPPLVEMEPPSGFPRAHAGTPPGTWSDDGALALCLLASLLYCGELDVGDLGRRFVNWATLGYMAVDFRVFDIGIQTADSISQLERGVAPEQAGGRDEYSNGNGSLMRVLPLALWHRGSDVELVRDAHRQSKLTHAHPRSQVCCAVYCLWARATLEGKERAWESAVETLRSIYDDFPLHLEELETEVLPDRGARGSGYVVTTLHSAREALGAGSFEEVVRSAIAFGEDTDTTAAVACGLAGVRDGEEAIPTRWLDRLRGRELVEPLLAQLV